MRIPLTRYGLPQVAVYPAIVLALMAALAVLYHKAAGPLLAPAIPRDSVLAAVVFVSGIFIAFVVVEAVLLAVFIWMLSFFRDPRREILVNDKALLSPADGTITDIGEAEIPGLEGQFLRIGMFLSIFNVHINRMPCAARIESVIYKKGKFAYANAANAGTINESNDVLMQRLAEPQDKLLVRQVSGAVARRIVCEAEPGQEYAQGFAFGMIKFGSRTELYLPLKEGRYDITIKIGDKVRAGLSPLVVYRPC